MPYRPGTLHLLRAHNLPPECTNVAWFDLGTIEAGKLADVIVVKGNVLENLNNLQHVTHVIKGGRVYK